MPSPFPGMDPFLESPVCFGTLHAGLIYNIQAQLKRTLPPGYYAASSDRLWVEVSERPIEPDVNVLRTDDARPTAERAGGASAVAEPVVVTVPHDEHREAYVDIITRGPDGEIIVATIEVLSPSNKERRSEGRRLYLKKQREILGSDTHLIEIDLLRCGEHTTAVPRTRAERKAGRLLYHVCVHRSDDLEDYFVYPVGLRDKLPRFAVPLLDDDGPAVIDLQAAFDRTYDDGPFDQRVDYRGPVPEPPLPPEDAAWVDESLKAAGK